MKISGPVLDRIDIQVEVKPLRAQDIMDSAHSESSSAIRERVIRARELQTERLEKYHLTLNAMMGAEIVKKLCPLSDQIEKLLHASVDRFKLSVRAYYKVIKVSRTIADLAQREHICMEDVLEALSYREVENILYNRLFMQNRVPIENATRYPILRL